MRVMKNKVALLSAAVASIFAAAAQAQVTLPTSGAATGAAVYASEINLNSGPGFATVAGAANNVVVSQLGFGVSPSQTVWMRFNLGSATFATTVAYTSGTTLLINDGMGMQFTAAGGSAIIAQGGQAGQNFIVFQVTAGTNGLPFTNSVTFVPGVGIAMQNSTGGTSSGTITPATIRYTLHGTQVSSFPSSGSPDSAIIIGYGPGTYINTKAAYAATFATAANTGETIASIVQFQKFCSGAAGAPGTAGCLAAATDVDALVGGLSAFGIVSSPPLDRTGVAVAGLSTITTANTVAVTPVAGDLNVATAAYWADAATYGCNAAGTAGSFNAAAPGRTTANFPFTTTALAGGSLRSLCVTVSGTSAAGTSAPQVFNGTLTPTSATGYTVGAVSGPATGTWTRDGTTLQTPWFNILSSTTSYVSRFFFMNTGRASVPCTASVYNEAGQTLTAGSAAAGFTIPANGYIEVTSPSIVASQSGGGSRAAAQFTCAGPTTNIQGRYVITHSSGAVDSGTLLRPGTN